LEWRHDLHSPYHYGITMWKLFTILLAVLSTVLAIGLGACYWERGWLTIDSAADLFSIFASIAVVVSLMFIAYQVEQQARLARASWSSIKLGERNLRPSLLRTSTLSILSRLVVNVL
jgi:hypothetical protein